MSTDQIKVLGADLGLNHAAFVELVDGDLGRFWYVTDKLESFKKGKKQGRAVLLKVPKEPKDTSELWRLSWWRGFIPAFIETVGPTYIGIEDYAYGASMRAHQIGELGGTARLAFWDSGLPFRLHDPLSVKLFATFDGGADKSMVEQAVRERWCVDFGEFNYMTKPNKKHPNGRVNRQTSEDLSDAYAVAKLVWTEVQLRCGAINLSDLHPKEIQVFNRTTKHYPINILGREFVRCPEDDCSKAAGARAADVECRE